MYVRCKIKRSYFIKCRNNKLAVMVYRKYRKYVMVLYLTLNFVVWLAWSVSPL